MLYQLQNLCVYIFTLNKQEISFCCKIIVLDFLIRKNYVEKTNCSISTFRKILVKCERVWNASLWLQYNVDTWTHDNIQFFKKLFFYCIASVNCNLFLFIFIFVFKYLKIFSLGKSFFFIKLENKIAKQ